MAEKDTLHTPADLDRLKLKRSLRFVSLFHNPLSAWTILAISLCLTILAYVISQNALKSRAEDRFEFHVQAIEKSIQDRLLVYEQVLRGGVALFNANQGHVSRDAFASYVATLQIEQNWPGIQGMGFSVPLSPEELDAHEAAIRAQGFPDYAVSPPGPRDAYSAIIYLEPFDWRNQRAFGYDMWSNPSRREAMARARDTGTASTSGLITLVQETDEDVQRGFLTYLPVYQGGSMPDSLDARRDRFAGWVYAPYRAGDLMEGIVGEEHDEVTVRVFDGTRATMSEETLLYHSADADIAHHHQPVFQTVREFSLQGKDWTVEYHTHAGYQTLVSDFQQPYYIFVSGLIIDSLLFYVIYSLYFINKRARNITRDWRRIIEQAPNALLIADEHGQVYLANEQAEILLGAPSRSLRSQNLRDLFDCPNAIFKEAFLRDEDTQRLDTEVERHDGVLAPVEVSIAPLNTLQGRFLVASLIDISERKKMQQMFEGIVEQAPNALVMTDESGNIVLSNAQADALFGYETGELRGKSIETLVPETHRINHPSYRARFFEAPKARAMGAGRDLSAQRKDGSEVRVEIGLNPVSIREERFVVASIVDITERKRAQSVLEDTNRKLQTKNQEMEQFIYTVSHDLKSPLVTIGGFAKLLSTSLEEMGATDKQLHQLKRIQANVNHMENLLGDLLQLSRVIRQGLDIEVVDVNALVDSVLSTFEAQIEELNATIVIQPAMPAIHANSRLLGQCVQNLISNALQYREPQRPLEIRIYASETATHVRLHVQDNGIGIEASYHEQIFRIFERLDVGEGTGVGLSIVKTIMDRHSAQVILTSTPGEGSTFTLEFLKHFEGVLS